MTTPKGRMTAWLSRVRADLTHIGDEIERMDDDGCIPDQRCAANQDLDEVRARVKALESRVQAIEGNKR